MADGTAIEWTDATWNPVTGCSVVSPGCTNCYAMKLAGTRLRNLPSRVGLTRASKAGPVWTGEVRLNEGWLSDPLRWRRPRRIFVCAHGDLFHESVPDAWIDRVFAVMCLAKRHTFQVLTKRADRMRAYLSEPETADRVGNFVETEFEQTAIRQGWIFRGNGFPRFRGPFTFPNVWLGVSVEDQARADERIPQLLATPAAVRWISAEPMLGPVDLTRVRRFDPGVADREYLDALGGRVWTDQTGKPNPDPSWAYPGRPFSDGARGIDWVVAGGESGSAARPMHPDWARSLRDQCAAAGVPFHFKQWGSWLPTAQGDRCVFPNGRHAPNLEPGGANGDGAARIAAVGKKAAGRLLDGVLHDAFPEAR